MSREPTCPHCGKANCVPCRALRAAEKIRTLRTDAQRAAGADLELQATLADYVIVCALLELQHLGAGRSELCDEHVVRACDHAPATALHPADA